MYLLLFVHVTDDLHFSYDVCSMLQFAKCAEVLHLHFPVCSINRHRRKVSGVLGSYRALYLLNWVYRFYFEGFFDLIAVVAGCVQTILYCDFFSGFENSPASLQRVRTLDCSQLTNFFEVFLRNAAQGTAFGETEEKAVNFWAKHES